MNTTDNTKTFGLIGLGLVGTALAECFTQAGFNVLGYDTDSSRTDALKRCGGVAADNACQIAETTDRIVLSLPNSDVVDAVMGSINDSLRPGTAILDTTTTDPARTEALAASLATHGVQFIDTTILGSSQQVREKDVIVMAGGDEDALDRCRDILDAFAREVFHMGDSGKGAETKLIANLVIGLNRLVLAEALSLGKKAGVSLDALINVLKAGSTYSRVMDIKGQKMIEGDFIPQARLAQHLKDVRLIQTLGERTGSSLPLTDLHAELLQSAVEMGLGGLDNSAIIRVFENGESTESG